MQVYKVCYSVTPLPPLIEIDRVREYAIVIVDDVNKDDLESLDLEEFNSIEDHYISMVQRTIFKQHSLTLSERFVFHDVSLFMDTKSVVFDSDKPFSLDTEGIPDLVLRET